MSGRKRERQLTWGDYFAYGVAGLVGFLAFAFGSAWFLFKVQVPNVLSLLGIYGNLRPADAVSLLTGVMTFFGGLVVAVMWWWRNAISAKEAETSRLQAKVALNTQISTDLTKAVELLGHKQMAVRIGAIYALEKVMRDVQDTDSNLHWSIIETLSGFARSKSKDQTLLNWNQAQESKTNDEVKKLKTDNSDIEAAFNIVAHAQHDQSQIKNLQGVFLRNFFHGGDNIQIYKCLLQESDFGNATLDKLVCIKCNFDGAFLEQLQAPSSQLDNVIFDNATLNKAVINDAKISNCSLTHIRGIDLNFENSQISDTKFLESNVPRINFSNTKMHNVDFTRSTMNYANFDLSMLNKVQLNCKSLENATFVGAKLRNVYIINTPLILTNFKESTMDNVTIGHSDLGGACFDGTIFLRSDLRHAKNLTQEQIDVAAGDGHTILPPGLTRPAHWG